MIREAIALVVEKKDLPRDQMRVVWEEITSGEATPAQIASLITALRMKGETVAEITAAAEVMRGKATRVEVDRHAAEDLTEEAVALVDTCGTGGDQKNTFNVSTCCAFVVAGAGVRVAKHGNRSVSSSCGSADVCEALGINLTISPEQVASCIHDVGIGFLFAPTLHGTMKHAIGPRKEIGVRTIFNILGPLSNPAGADFQLLGVYRRELTDLMAAVLGALGCKRAMVVHGEDGMDEITITGRTAVSEWTEGAVRSYTIHPSDFDIPVGRIDELLGSTAGENARIIREILEGRQGPKRDIVLLNAGSALYVAGAAATISQGIELAGRSIDQGKAKEKLYELIDKTSAMTDSVTP